MHRTIARTPMPSVDTIVVVHELIPETVLPVCFPFGRVCHKFDRVLGGSSMNLNGQQHTALGEGSTKVFRTPASLRCQVSRSFYR
jgi:hypothetical protein